MFTNTVFKRKFAMTMYRDHKILLGGMTFTKDFVTDTHGDPYPILEKSEDCHEAIEHNRYIVRNGQSKRFLGQFFPYATYEMTARSAGTAGFAFSLPNAEASIVVSGKALVFTDGQKTESISMPAWITEEWTMFVACRPGAFDVYFKNNQQPQYAGTFRSEEFRDSCRYDLFSNGYAAVCASGNTVVREVSFYIDDGISQADMRPIRYENGAIMMEQGKLYLSVSIRLQEGMMQGIFSWVPGTAQMELTGALYFDTGDGRWCSDVASSILYHRGKQQWYLWVCSFSHDHILGHAVFEGDPRFGVNVVDLQLMPKAPQDAPISAFLGMEGDEDPDFFYDERTGKWKMAICRIDPSIRAYRYVFFESDDPFDGYTYVGKGLDGNETGGSFVRVKNELFFLCGNNSGISDYRIYSKDGMTQAAFDYPDGGFRGWGTLMPVKMGSRTRYFWMTFDRHKGSDYTWSYGNLYCFEAEM